MKRIVLLLICAIVLCSCNNGTVSEQTNAETTASTVQNESEPKTALLSDYCKFESASIPYISEDEKGIKAEGSENVILGTK